mmetsp:Transcript_1321/g.3881  ORF Transcript_1321/g.3881 Transcript_1321/m.3881 type:complete len:155 (-) Transcript_1321:1345-1809(-)
MNAFVCAPNGARIRTRTRSKNNRTGVVRFAVSAVVRTDWKPSSWREKATVDAGVPLTEVSRLPPLVYSGEVDRLKSKLADVQTGKAFLLKAGDREEDFTITQGENTEATFRLLVAQVRRLSSLRIQTYRLVCLAKTSDTGMDRLSCSPMYRAYR